MSVSNNLVKADKVCDYVPVVSTISNLVDLFRKYVTIPKLKESGVDIAENRYYTHLSEKSTLRSVVLLLPILGNITVALYDHYQKKCSVSLLANLKARTAFLYSGYVSEAQKNDKKIVTAAIEGHPYNFKYASETLRDDKEVALPAVKKMGCMLSHASGRLKDDEEVVLAAVLNDAYALESASDRLKDKDSVVAVAVKVKYQSIRHASESIRNDKERMSKLAQINPSVLIYASDEVKKALGYQSGNLGITFLGAAKD